MTLMYWTPIFTSIIKDRFDWRNSNFFFLTKHVQPKRVWMSAVKPCGLALLLLARTGLALQRRRTIRLPHGNILPAHGPAPSLLLRLVPVNVPHAHPGPAPQSASSSRAHRPLGVILRCFEGDPAARRQQVHVQNLPPGGAVGPEDAGGATPELHQQVRLQRGSHPAMV